jgi:hypothetical protein
MAISLGLLEGDAVMGVIIAICQAAADLTGL